MNQNDWARQDPEETHQARGQQVQRPAPGRVTRTSRLSSPRGSAVQRKPAAAGDTPRRASDSRTGALDLDMDMAHRGLTALVEHARDAPRPAPVQRELAGVVQMQRDTGATATQPEASPSGHPVPLDEFLRVIAPARLHRLPDPAQATGEPGTPDIASEPQVPVTGSGTQAPGPADLIPTTILLAEGTFVRAATPAHASGQVSGRGPVQVPGHRYICTAAGLFGWVPAGSVEPTAAPEAVEGAEDVDEEAPQDDMPTLAASDYDNLVILDRDVVVYRRASEEANPVTVAHRMESVVYVGEARTEGSRRWQRIRLVREPRDIGWIQDAGTNTSVASAMAGGMPDLRFPTTHPMVAEVEQMLANLGFDPGPIDETFDEATDRAVRAFQTDRGITVDGVVGPQTLGRLRSGVTGDGLSEESGSTGPLVREVEQLLEDLGYQPGTVDGTFDETTDRAVRSFQRDHSLVADGVVGTITMEALRNAVSPAPIDPQAGMWVAGFTLRGETPGRAMTPDGQVSSAGFVSAAQGGGSMMAAGPCEVLHRDGSPAVMETDGKQWWYVRGADGGAGWTPTTNVQSSQAEGATGTPVTGTSIIEELAQLCPNGITVAFVTQFNNRERSFGTFLSEGAAFADTHHAVAISGGQLVTGTANLITHKDQVIAVLASIQQALRAGAPDVPPWARVAHLAFFTHGADSRGPEWGGLETDADGWDDDGVLHEADLAGFASSLAAFCTSNVEVSMFACSTGLDFQEESNYQGWLRQGELRGGEGSFADDMADELADAGASDAMVMGHTTIGHTVRNPAARLYTGSDAGGVNVFEYIFLPVGAWLADELADLARTPDIADGQAFLERELFAWFRDDVIFQDSQASARMSTDPELFRVEMRERARDWVRSQYRAWGVVTAEMYASRRAVLRRSGGDREPNYRWGTAPDTPVIIPAGTEITIQGPAEVINGIESYPVTWAEDPHARDSASPVQAYLPVDWVEEVYD